MADYYSKEGDSGGVITITCKDSAGVAVNLTGCTVRFNMARQTTREARIAAAATLSDAFNGVVTYTFIAGDFVAGTYDAEVKATFASGEIRRFPRSGSLVIEVGQAAGS